MSKGSQTRQRIIERAFGMATVSGLEGVTIGQLADEVDMSKSGLFAHFRSKEDLDLAVIEAAVNKFVAIVIRPALVAERGLPRVRALFERWLLWAHHQDLPGGCPFVQFGAELDDRPGRARDAFVESQRRWFETLSRAAGLAVEAGHFRRSLDVDLFAAQFHGILLTYAHVSRIQRDRRAEKFARATFDALLAAARRPQRVAARMATQRARRSKP
jgi:AcrR family transcriptional regulator